jgi:soluble lytic murein transglycosylase-like protein
MKHRMRTFRIILGTIVLLTFTIPGIARPDLAELYSGQDLYRRLAQHRAIENGIPLAILDAVMNVESAYRPTAIGDAGEVGLMQVLPSTAAMLGYEGSLEFLATPEINIQYGAQYLAGAWRLAAGDICTTVMKYRAGHGETRFSQKSVNYCVRVREKLRAAGYPVTGKVPKATLGFASVTKLRSGRVRASFPGSSSCFLRVIQPGSNYGKCISRRTLKAKKLLR